MIVRLLELLGQTAPYADREGPARGGAEGSGWGDFVWAVLGVAALAGAVWLTRWVIRRAPAAPAHDPNRLFAGLCQAHGLNRSDRRMLRRLARSRGLADPARLFVEPQFFEVPSSDPTLGSQAGCLNELRQRLFGA
jgi:hypothetical protein